MAERVYLDWNATAPLRPEAKAAMVAAMEVTGNPSSVHAEGRAAKALIEKARVQVAAAVGCAPGEVVFTSGATEAAMVLAGGADVEETSHDCLWAHHTGTGPRVMGLANNETGVLGKAQGAHLVDLVQAVGKVPVAFSWMDCALGIVSAHKFGGPKGVGALIVRQGTDSPALAIGGGQEMGRRSGTENIVGIAGMGAAAEAAARDLAAGLWDRVATRRDALEARLAAEAPGTIFVGADLPRLPNTSCLVTPGWKGETQVMQMDLAGFAVSAGSACSSGKVRPSRVLKAMGFSDADAASAIRVSIGPATTPEDLDAFADAWLAARARQLSRAA